MKKNVFVAVSLVSIIGLFIRISWGTLTQINNNECIIGKEKKFEGILFGGCFDIWHFSHVILWGFIGVIAPNYYLQVITVSILWELIENYFFKKFKICDSIFCGRVEDPIINILAYFLGSRCF
jgi:hypothetical protein